MADAVRIVVIDDNPGSLELLSAALSRTNAVIYTASTPLAGLEIVCKVHPQLVITDLVMPEMSGLDVLQKVIQFDPLIDVILMTAHYTTETAVAAIRQGAADYLQKPVKISLLRDRVGALVADSEKRRHPGASGTQDSSFEGIVAGSLQMWNLFAMMQRVAPHYRSILIRGETGTGKDLIAGALHRCSRVSGKLVIVNCSAIVETLFESELFGHVKGAFTGADRDKTGLFELADGGTLFLDEIGDMPVSTQAKLLRALQNQEILRVGALTPRKINVRVIAATHRNLRTDVAEGRFREDLYYRLCMVELVVPPLRERVEDIMLLALHFLKKFNAEFGTRVEGFSPRASLALQHYAWPGNVRELEHAIGRACMMAEEARIDIADLPAEAIQKSDANHRHSEGIPHLADQERMLLEEALQTSGGNQSEAARKLGIGRDALRYKMKRFNLKK